MFVCVFGLVLKPHKLAGELICLGCSGCSSCRPEWPLQRAHTSRRSYLAGAQDSAPVQSGAARAEEVAALQLALLFSCGSPTFRLLFALSQSMLAGRPLATRVCVCLGQNWQLGRKMKLINWAASGLQEIKHLA